MALVDLDETTRNVMTSVKINDALKREFLADHFHVSSVDVSQLKIEPDLLRCIDRTRAMLSRCVPTRIHEDSGRVFVATHNPKRVKDLGLWLSPGIEEGRHAREVICEVDTPENILATLKRYYGE